MLFLVESDLRLAWRQCTFARGLRILPQRPEGRLLFQYAQRFTTGALAHVLDSLVRVSRRVISANFVSISNSTLAPAPARPTNPQHCKQSSRRRPRGTEHKSTNVRVETSRSSPRHHPGAVTSPASARPANDYLPQGFQAANQTDADPDTQHLPCREAGFPHPRYLTAKGRPAPQQG